MDWMVGAAQLDAAQRRTIDAVVKDPSRNHWIKGFAGTGKTIVIAHILKRLAADRDVSTLFATYTYALKEMVESGLTPAEIKSIKSTTFKSIRHLDDSYDVLVADEFQDMPKTSLAFAKSKASALVIAADPAQRLYRFSIKETELLRAVRPVREHKLLTIHRINLPVYTVATTIFPDAEFSPGKAPADDREPVQIMSSTSRMNESLAVFAEASRLAKPGSPSAILVPSNDHLRAFLSDVATKNGWGTVPKIRDAEESDDPFGSANRFLKRQKTPLQLFGSQSGSLNDSDVAKTVYLMTYHNSKGLEFPYVFMPSMTSRTCLEPMKNASVKQQARIFFVAATRAKERLHLSYHGEPHQFIDDIRELDSDVVTEFSNRKRRY
jgi:superfamily I DNA and RNA helicase